MAFKQHWDGKIPIIIMVVVALIYIVGVMSFAEEIFKPAPKSTKDKITAIKPIECGLDGKPLVWGEIRQKSLKQEITMEDYESGFENFFKQWESDKQSKN